MSKQALAYDGYHHKRAARLPQGGPEGRHAGRCPGHTEPGKRGLCAFCPEVRRLASMCRQGLGLCGRCKAQEACPCWHEWARAPETVRALREWQERGGVKA